MTRIARTLAPVTALFAAVLLASCSSGAANTPVASNPEVATDVDFPADSAMAKIHDAGTIRIGTKFDQPLFGLKNPHTGTPEGFDAEMGKLIAAKLGIPADKIEWVETASANREPFLQQGRVDLVIATYTINDKRKQIIEFGGPYYIAGQALMVQAGNPDAISGPEDLSGKDVCSVEGSASSTNIRELVPTTNVVLFDSYSKCADALKNDQVEAVTTDNTILAGLQSLDPDSFELVDNTFTEEPYGVGISEDNEELATFVDTVLEKSFENGEWSDAWDNTAGQVLGPAPTPPDLDSY